MDLTKAQRLLLKIQTFLDDGNGNELSRLEKDLLKTYIQQLYDAVTSEDAHHWEEKQRPVEPPVHKAIKIEVPPVHTVEPPKPQPPRPEPPKPEPPKPEPPKHEIPKMEPFKVVIDEPEITHDEEFPIEERHFEPEPVVVIHKPEPIPIQIPIIEPVRETVQAPKVVSTPIDKEDALAKLFELSTAADIAGRFNQVPISSIESAMGLNERIFTLKELFGGDKGLFDATCAALNNLNTFSEAKSLLLHGPAKQFRWSEPERLKMAEQFIRIVVRRYPQS